MEKALKEIIKGCVNNDRKCQELLYHTYSKIMYGVCLGYTKDREEAKDVLQEGFIKVFKNIEQFSGEGSIEGWIRRIIVNTAIDYFRKKSRRGLSVDFDKVPEISIDYSILETINAKEVLELIQKLPEGAKIIFNLHIVEGYTHEQIAKILDIS